MFFLGKAKNDLFGTIVPNLWTHPGLEEIWVIQREFNGNFRQKMGLYVFPYAEFHFFPCILMKEEMGVDVSGKAH